MSVYKRVTFKGTMVFCFVLLKMGYLFRVLGFRSQRFWGDPERGIPGSTTPCLTPLKSYLGFRVQVSHQGLV